uniref:Ribonuclease H-like domain-containing protein n=1 Tax=Tanacetum cinerariifolium TaxID=118510 RepID=A0A6L2K369_TANCI|nr:ribonuclease H-like domain-containing protein [Tanacetum cinerariifolium]
MRMEQYLTHTDYALWEVIMNGDAPVVILSISGGAKAAIPPKTTVEKITRRKELKAKSTMLLAIPDEHLLKFYGIKDEKTLWEAIKTREQTPLFPTMLAIQAAKDNAVYEEWDDSVERVTTTAACLDAAQDSGIDGSMYNIVRLGSSFIDRLKADKESIWYCLYQAYHESEKIRTTVKSNQDKGRTKIVVLDDEEDSEDSSKQGRMIEDIYQDTGITLVTPTNVSSQEDQPEDQLGVLSAAKFLTDAAKKKVNTYIRRRRVVSTGSVGVSTASVKDKGKAIMQDSEQPKKIKKRVQIQMSLNGELAQKLYEEEQARFNAEQEAKFNAEQEELLASETTRMKLIP